MARDPKYDVLFEPIKIGPKTMRNRFYKTPHSNNYGTAWPGRNAHFRAMPAEGGFAVVNTDYCSIHPSSDDNPWVSASLWDDNDIRNLALFCDKIHQNGALTAAELWYGGAHQTNYDSRIVARGVSQIPSDFHPVAYSMEMTKGDIRELQGWYVAAAKRARSAGFDIVNVYGGHGHPIIYQFLEPFFNKRTDEYGGSFENRARFWRETIELVKEAVGDDCAIAVRASLDSLRDEDGLHVEDTIAFVQLVDHMVDLWDFQLGGVIAEWGEDTLPSRFSPQGYQRPWVEKVRPYTSKPIVGVGRFTSPDVMVEMITKGPLDIIGSARGSIADPFLPRKIEEGRLDDIRECIGCNTCTANVMLAAPLVCTQNATAGEEYRRGWHPEKFSIAKNHESDVLVVGAGPAGMECATVLGKRGLRRVHLVEAQDDMGGIMRWVTQLPGLGEWGRLVDYRRIQLGKLKNVEFIPNARLDAKGVAEYGADHVVLATGSRWVEDGLNFATHKAIPGADARLPHIVTPEQLMVSGKQVGARVFIYDCDGYFTAASLAEKLAGEGREVTLVTPHAQIAPSTFFTLEGWRINRNLHRLGVTLVTEHLVTSIEPGRVMGCHGFAPDREVGWEADSVVLVTQRRSNDALYRELDSQREALTAEGILGLYRIGDCVAPRRLADAVYEGHRLAREIDTADPGTPLPYIRENRVLGNTNEQYDGMLTHLTSQDYIPNSQVAVEIGVG